MARIRTIKPEFWTDEKIVQLPFSARLVFIGLWNFADDDGRIRDEPDRLRMQIMPGDPVDMELALDVLVAAELIERWYGDDGSVILVVPGFGRHQLISHKSKSKLPLEAYRKAAIPVAARRQVAQEIWLHARQRKPSGGLLFLRSAGFDLLAETVRREAQLLGRVLLPRTGPFYSGALRRRHGWKKPSPFMQIL